jgi:hypothetical protein
MLASGLVGDNLSVLGSYLTAPFALVESRICFIVELELRLRNVLFAMQESVVIGVVLPKMSFPTGAKFSNAMSTSSGRLTIRRMACRTRTSLNGPDRAARERNPLSGTTDESFDPP